MVHYLQLNWHQTGCGRRRLHLHLHRLWRHRTRSAQALVATVGGQLRHSSSDGTKTGGCCCNGARIYTLPTLAPPWTERTSAGMQLVVHYFQRRWHQTGGCGDGGSIYTSTDSGATWTERAAGSNSWPITSSADGTKPRGCCLLAVHLHLPPTLAPPGRRQRLGGQYLPADGTQLAVVAATPSTPPTLAPPGRSATSAGAVTRAVYPPTQTAPN